MLYLIDGRYIQDRFPGIGRYVYNLVQGLARVAPKDQFRVLVNPRLRNTRFDIDALNSSNVHLCPVDTPTVSLKEQWLGLGKALTGDIALWHSAYYIEPYFMRAKNILTLEDIIPLVDRSEMPSASRRLLYRVLTLTAVRRAAGVITLSQAARVDIERVLLLPAKKMTVVPLAADARFGPMSAAQVGRVRSELGLPPVYGLYVGSNKPHKNLVRLVQAWAQVPTRIPLIIAGHWDPRYREPLRMAERLNLDGRIRFIQNVSSDDLPGLVSGAFLFVFPSLQEGFGLPPLEAMACGVPVACANASSLPEVVGNAAALFDPLDVANMVETLSHLLEDRTLLSDLANRGLARSARFSWDRTAEETLKVYRAYSSSL